jgi:hypothetical protein
MARPARFERATLSSGEQDGKKLTGTDDSSESIRSILDLRWFCRQLMTTSAQNAEKTRRAGQSLLSE